MVRVGIALAVASTFLAAIPSLAGVTTPAVLTSASNKVPACATPSRLMAYLKSRNPGMGPQFKDIASYYKQHGEELGVRWDYAFFQMIVETNSLKFKTPRGRWGDVLPKQNNFAGLGATGNRAPGETFPDVSTGVLAHLQHIRLYAGEPVDSPVAERTKLVQDLILPWAQGFGRPVTYTDLTKKWAPKGKRYAEGIENIARIFRQGYCKGGADEVVAPSEEITASNDTATRMAAVGQAVALSVVNKAREQTAAAADEQAVTGEQPAAADSDGDGDGLAGVTASDADLNDGGDGGAEPVSPPAGKAKKTAAKAGKKAKGKKTKVAAATLADADGDGLADAPTTQQAAEAASTDVASTAKAEAEPQDAPQASASDFAVTETASTAQLASLTVPAQPPAGEPKECKVFTASYGGGKSILIQSVDGDLRRLTALTVNEGKEDVQARAFINVYAKGGESIGQFATQNEALSKAFQLCPEG